MGAGCVGGVPHCGHAQLRGPLVGGRRVRLSAATVAAEHQERPNVNARRRTCGATPADNNNADDGDNSSDDGSDNNNTDDGDDSSDGNVAAAV